MWQLLLILIVVALIVVVVLRVSGPSVVPGSRAFRRVSVAPTPVEVTFDGCPPSGDNRFVDLNARKNRVDTAAQYQTVPIDSVLMLSWPRTAEREPRSRWSFADRAAIDRFEGLPVAIEGYVAGARVEGPEATNCHGKDPRYRDWHIWITDAPGVDRTRAVVVEATPRVRALLHPEWTISALQDALEHQARVRVSGWLMFDPEHPDQVGRTRGTIWEIHPITRLEVAREGVWQPLSH